MPLSPRHEAEDLLAARGRWLTRPDGRARRTTTKKNRAASALEAERPRARHAPEAPAQQWTTSHVVIALA